MIPVEIIQGDSASWTDTAYNDAANNNYVSDSYTQTTVIAGPITAPVSIIASANGSGWKTLLTAEVSASLVPGHYWWETVLTKTGERVTRARGELDVIANLALAGANYDGRSLAAKALADAETALATFRSTRGRTKKYTIGIRSMEFDSAADILAEINYWKLRVANENTATSIANGLGNPRRLAVRFTKK